MKLEGLKAFGNTVIQYARQFYSTFAGQLDFFFDSYDLYSIKDQHKVQLNKVLNDIALLVNMNRFGSHQGTK